MASLTLWKEVQACRVPAQGGGQRSFLPEYYPRGWGFNSVVESLPNKQESLGLVLSSEDKMYLPLPSTSRGICSPEK